MRYSRQTAFAGLGESGQQKLSAARVAVVGVGALGTVAANCLARAGAGFLRLIDRDYVELTNLHRQMLFTENDARRRIPKAAAAAARLAEANSEIVLEPIVADFNAANAETFLSGIDLVLDAVDNWECRFLLNDICRQKEIPWIYCAALAAEGMTMNFLPGHHPCLQCVVPKQTLTGLQPTCVTAGVLNMAAGAIASIQAAEAVKILTDSPTVRQGLFTADFWNNRFKTIPFEQDADCPVCVHRRFDRLTLPENIQVLKICGQNTIQITPFPPRRFDLENLAGRLQSAGKIDRQPFMVSCETEHHRLTFFSDGRALIENAADEGQAKSLYAEYAGT
ncbi:MAG: ThiF family adenylyltransferase [Planctomycetaceae bacterium]|jgi:adenylyltransferase/sulfurtransferase|nr:ThiF family adenylyltransferase [Planctomycetaceae bacterium]